MVYKRVAVVRETGPLSLYNDGQNDWSNVSSFAFGYEWNGSVLRVHRNNPGGSGISQKSPHPGNNIPFILSTKFDGTNNTVYYNGTAQTAVASTGNFNIDKVLIGCRRHNGYYSPYKGNIAEFIVFERALSDQERNDITQYLSLKWGISVS